MYLFPLIIFMCDQEKRLCNSILYIYIYIFVFDFVVHRRISRFSSCCCFFLWGVSRITAPHRHPGASSATSTHTHVKIKKNWMYYFQETVLELFRSFPPSLYRRSITTSTTIPDLHICISL